MSSWRNHLTVRLWVISLAFFAGGFAARLAAKVAGGEYGPSDPGVFGIQCYAYSAGLAAGTAWLALKAEPPWDAVGGIIGGVLVVISFFAVMSSARG